MRILLVTGLFPPDIGGPATYSKLLSDEFPKRGIRVDVLSFGSVRLFPKVVRHTLFFSMCLTHGFRADLVYAQDPVSVGFPALLAARILRKPFVVRVAGDYAWEQAVQRHKVQDTIDSFQTKTYGFKTEFLRKVQRFVVQKADKVITPSKYFQKLVSGWTLKSDHIVTIYNGIDLHEVEVVKDVVPKHKTIISAGRLVPWKGFGTLIEMLPKLPDWKLTIVGDGPEEMALRKQAESLDVASRVIFMGRLSRRELLKQVASHEIFILNTSFESFSFQVVEAMAVGTPVIATNIGNLSEIIEDGKEGILVAPDDKEAIVQGVTRLSNDPKFRITTVAAAQEKATRFSIEVTLRATEDILRGFVS